ncbi:MAG TPA: hypothetical protein VI483_00775 [Candidatus Paceibacterota bacterium]
MGSLRQPPLKIDVDEARRLVEQFEKDGGANLDSGEDTLLVRYFRSNQDPEALALAERFDQALRRWSK